MEVHKPSTISEHDKEEINNLRMRVTDSATPDFTDFDYLRWLQGHDYDIELIVPKLRGYFRLVRSYDFSNGPMNKVCENYWPMGMLDKTTGKDDNFVYIYCIGSTDGVGVMKSMPMHHHRMFNYGHIEQDVLPKIRRREKETGRQSGILLIVDLDKSPMTLSALMMLIRPYRMCVQCVQDNYVELLQKALVVNVPFLVHIMWRLISPALNEKTRQKFVFLGSDWKNELSKYVDPDSLPQHWGGNLIDENNDPQYKSRIVVPTKVPLEHFWTKSDSDPDPSEMQTLYVNAGGFAIVTVEVTDVGSTLSWYYTADRDFGFGVFFTAEEIADDVGAMDMVYPQFRQLPGPSIAPEYDQILCKRKGFYKFWFGNEHSWVWKSKIKYLTRIVPPNQ